MTNVTRVVLAADSSQVRRATGALQGMQRSGLAAQSAVASVGRSLLGLASGAAAVSAIQGAVQRAADFESGLVGVAKTTGLLSSELEDLSNRFSLVSSKIPVTTAELLGIAQAAGQMGVTGADNLERFTVTVAKLGRASDLSGDEAATALARILNVTGEGIDTADTLASVIVSLGNSVAATESEIARMTNEVVRATSQFDISSAQAAAMSAAMASIGLPAETAGTSVGRAMQEITNRVQSGGESLDEFADALAINGDTLAELFESDRVAAFEMFLEAVGDLGLDAGTALGELNLGGQEIVKTLVPLANNMGLFRKSMELANEEVRNATALDREFDATLATLQSQFQVTQNVIGGFSRRLGNEMLPNITEALTTFNTVMSAELETALAGASEDMADFEKNTVSLGDVSVWIAALIADVFGTAFNTIGGGFQALGNTLGAGAAQLMLLLQGELDAAREVGRLWQEDMVIIFEGVADFDTDRFRETLEKIRADQDNAADDAKDSAQNLKSELQRIAESIEPIELLPLRDPDDSRFDEAQSFFDQSRTQAERLRAQIERIKELMADGFFPEGGEEVLERYNAMLDETLKTTESVGQQVTQSLAVEAGGAIEEMFARGEISASNFFESVLRQIAQVAAEILIVKPLIESLFGSSGSGGLIGGALSGFISGLLPGAGDSLQMIDTAALPQKIQGFADGTDSAPGGLSFVGEEGVELVDLPRGSRVVPNHDLDGIGGKQIVNIIDQRQPGAPPVEMEKSSSNGVEEIKIFIRDELRTFVAEGGMDQTLQGTGMVGRRRGHR